VSIISDPRGEIVAIRGFLVLPDQRDQGYGRRQMQALIQRYPGKDWRVPALCPEEYGGFFERVGFTRGQLSQIQMEVDLVGE
jgi:N-acetylglutamate synthase-like GNAT family acetyltransferase